MKRQTISRILTATAILLVAPSVAGAQERGSVQAVIHDAYGHPLPGAFVKLKNDERRLTFMVVSRENGQFEAKDLPPGQYRVQGVAGANQSDWFNRVQVTPGGSAKVGMALTHHRGPMLPPAWPQRIPEAQVDQIALDLPEGDGKALVAEKCASCHDLRRVVVKRSNRDHWAHTVARMRTRMSVASIPDLSEQETTKIVDYLVAHFDEVQPYDPNSRLPTAVQTGKAVAYRVVTYDLVNSHAEPHEVPADPKGNG